MVNHARVVFSFDNMIASLHKAVEQFPDKRTGKNTQYKITDAALGAFSVFFTQCPSFLQYQQLMEQKYGLSNARTLFGIHDIPSDNHIRNLLDDAKPSLLSPVFTDCLQALKESGDLDCYRVPLGKNNNDVLIALDGTQYFGSDTIHCKKCSTKIKDNVKLYYHTVVTPTIVAPRVNKVVSLMPEFITPQDGDSKQDCELKASKRWLKSNDDLVATLGSVTMLGDDLYAHEPFARSVIEKGYNFLFVCKPESHKGVYAWVKGITKEKTEDIFDGKNHQIYTYHYVQGVPLKDTEDSLVVNFVEVTVKDRKTGKQLYHNAFVTNHPLEGTTEQETKRILATIVNCGRARWKIENENNNTLKTQGYHLEHNFGHGKNNLASVLATMNILTFLFHTMLEFMNEKYQLVRKMVGSRKTLFNDIRTMCKLFCFKSFDSFLQFMIDSLQKPANPETLVIPI
jgi:hypothetical protein